MLMKEGNYSPQEQEVLDRCYMLNSLLEDNSSEDPEADNKFGLCKDNYEQEMIKILGDKGYAAAIRTNLNHLVVQGTFRPNFSEESMTRLIEEYMMIGYELGDSNSVHLFEGRIAGISLKSPYLNSENLWDEFLVHKIGGLFRAVVRSGADIRSLKPNDNLDIWRDIVNSKDFPGLGL